MSLILDALKKLEREKAAQSNKTGDIAVSILEQKPIVRNRRPIVFMGAIAMAAAVFIAGMYIAFLMDNKHAPLSTAAPLAPVPQQKTGPAPVETPAPPPAAAEPMKASPATVKESPVKKKAKPEKLKLAEPEKKASPPPAGAIPSRPNFTISVIVWYDQPSERKAVIDGKSVREGDIIDGFKVQRIDLSSVSFVKNGKPFEVSINR